MKTNSAARDLYNVEFAGDHFWIGTTIIATDKDSAIDTARDHIAHTSQIPFEVISQMPHVEAEYVGEQV